MTEFVKQLNNEQKKAATHKDGPLLVVAGAGTGKTTVLIERLNYLIKNKLAKPDEILITTFTEKAAGEMEERADKILPYGYTDLWINTFHGFCERILRDHALDIGLSADFKLLTQTEQWMMIRRHLDEFELDYYRPLGNPTKFIHELIKHFSRLKDENISSEEYLKYAEDLEQDTDSMLDGSKETKEQEVDRINEIANAFHKYNQLLLENSYLDFGDLIVYTIKLFKERPNVLKGYQEQFKYIMVDEFQDTNWSQYELIKILAEPKNNLMVVGDDDQCLPGSTKILLPKNKEKRIDKIKVGEEVVTAVGKGHLCFSKVKHVNKTIKKAKLITFKTEKGRTITTTDNHKMFCFVNEDKYAKEVKKYFYVYLMHKEGLGWRMGITNNLIIRLRLERKADKVVAIKACKNEIEARYQENLLSLKYGIPTNVFAERDGIMTKKELVEKLYKELDVESGVIRLAQDLGIDLTVHQVSSNGVNRSGKVRIKINLEMCYRNYRSKYRKVYLKTPNISHLLSVETTHKPTILKLKKMGFDLKNARLGKRLRIQSEDLSYLGKIAKKIQKEIGGIVENRFNVGTANIQHKRSLVVPASNILEGMYIPVVTSKGVIYDQIISRKEKKKKTTVYDLEIEKTHNFIANGIAVHNSIYAFRGSSMHNIMQFEDDFPKTKKVVLTKNYRSGEEILDASYNFIKHNDPNRLEVKLGIDKKLTSPLKKKGDIVNLNFHTEAEETSSVVKEIVNIKASEKESKWSDFAILVRANSTAVKFVNELDRAGIPNQFVSLRGLYQKPIVVDILAYLKLLDNYHESSALYRVLNMEVFKVTHSDIVTINKFARRKVWSTFEALRNIDAIKEISETSRENIKKLLIFIGKHSEKVKKSLPSKVYVSFVRDTGLLKDLDHDKDREIFDYLNQFYQKIKTFESDGDDLRLSDFMKMFEMELESGETGSLRSMADDPDVVKVMTVHAAKGLEFDYVFMPGLVDKKFPVINRKEKITIPEKLVREVVPEGDIHTEEERRLFYVAVTRAKRKLYLTTAKDYGGAREKKPSKFLEEMGEVESRPPAGRTGKLKVARLPDGQESQLSSNELLDDVNAKTIKRETETLYALPKMYSFSQLEAYSNCPLQYKFNFILKIPVEEKVSFIFGRVMHNVLKDFFERIIGGNSIQPELFSSTEEKEVKRPTEKELLQIYKERWNDNGYHSKLEREKYKKKGEDILRDLYKRLEEDGWPKVMFVEKGFNVRIGQYTLRGSIDRIDRLPDETVEIVDYKTGNPKEKLDAKSKRQLILYKIACEQVLGLKVSKLSYYYLENNNKISFEAKDKEIEKQEEQIIAQIEEIKKCNFTAKPGFLCAYCDFKDICEFKKL